MSDISYKIGNNNYIYDSLSGKWFIEGSGAFVRNHSTLAQLENATGLKNQSGKKSRIRSYNNIRKQTITRLERSYGKFFSSKSVEFTGKGGHIKHWAKPLTLRGGANPNYNWSRPQYRGANDKKIRGSSTSLWGSNINSNAPATVLVGTKQWIKQLRISIHALYIQSEHFRIAVGQRAIKVFQNSFKYQQFYSNRTQRWKPLSAYTLKKRAARRKGNRILKEYDDLYDSIKIEDNAMPMTTRVYTEVVPANPSHHKKHSICYAGYHNEGRGTYGRGWNGHKPKPYVKRQFMGHSSHLDPYIDSFLRKIMKMYLFDSVFLVKKV